MKMQKRKPIFLTQNAIARIQDLLKKADKSVVGIRISLKNSGCAGMAYLIDYITEVHPLDEFVDEDDIRVYIDHKNLLFLIGTEVDFDVSPFSSTFTFKNPRQISSCGCGESVSIAPLSL